MIEHPAALTGEFEQVVMIAVSDRRWLGRTEFLPQRFEASPGWNARTFNQSEMALFFHAGDSGFSEARPRVLPYLGPAAWLGHHLAAAKPLPKSAPRTSWLARPEFLPLPCSPSTSWT